MSTELYLFISAKKNYHTREFLNVACFSEGAKVVVAYDEKWLSPHLRDANKLIDRAALVSFNELDEKSDARTKLHPARWVKVVDCEHQDWGAFKLTLELGKFQNYLKNDHEIERMILNFRQFISGLPENPVMIGRQPYYLVEGPKWPGKSESDNWVALAKHLRRLFVLDKATFFQLTTQSDDLIFPVAAMASRKEWAFEVPAPSVLSAVLRVIPGKDTVLVPPSISLSPTLGSVQGPLTYQFGEGLDCHYRIEFLPQLRGQGSVIQIKASPSTEVGLSPSFDAFVSAKPLPIYLYQVLIIAAALPFLAVANTCTVLGLPFSPKILGFLASMYLFGLITNRLKIV